MFENKRKTNLFGKFIGKTTFLTTHINILTTAAKKRMIPCFTKIQTDRTFTRRLFLTLHTLWAQITLLAIKINVFSQIVASIPNFEHIYKGYNVYGLIGI